MVQLTPEQKARYDEVKASLSGNVSTQDTAQAQQPSNIQLTPEQMSRYRKVKAAMSGQGDVKAPMTFDSTPSALPTATPAAPGLGYLPKFEPEVAATTGTHEKEIPDPSVSQGSDPVLGWSADDFVESTKRVVGGTLSGLSLGATDQLLEVNDKTKSATSYKVSRFIGEMKIISRAGKFASENILGRLSPYMQEVYGTLAKIGTTGATGAGMSVGKAAIDPNKDVSAGEAVKEGISWASMEAGFAMMKLIPGWLRSLRPGDAVRNNHAVKRAAGERAQQELARLADDGMITDDANELSMSLRVNDVSVGLPKSTQARTGPQLFHPEVNRGELLTLKQIPEQPTGNLATNVNKSLENGIRMHERLGTKEMFYDAWRTANNNSVVATAKSLSNFKQVIKNNIKFGSRGKASRRTMIYAVAQQRGGAKVLAEMGIKEIPVLSKQEMAVYEHMRFVLDDLYKRTNAVRVASGIEPYREVKNYFTFMRSFNGEVNNGSGIIDASRFAAKKAEKSAFRYENGRILDDYGELELDAYKVFGRYVQSAENHVALTPHIAKFRQFLDGKFYDGFKLAESNPGAYASLNAWVNHIAGIPSGFKNETMRGVERVANRLNNNLAYAVLSYNIRSAAIQPTAIVNAATEIGPRWALEGVSALMGNGSSAKRAFIRENSSHMASRTMDISMFDAMNPVSGQPTWLGKKFGKIVGDRGAKAVSSAKQKLSVAREKAGKFGMMPLQKLDEGTAYATWWGSYRKATESLGMSKSRAIKYADDVVVRTQASAAPGDIAPAQRTALGKSATAFQTFVVNNWGFLTRDVAGIGNKSINKKQAAQKIGRYIAGVTIFNTIYEDVLHMRSPFPAPISAFRREYEKSDDKGKAFWSSIIEMTELVPIVGGTARYGSSPVGAPIQTVTDAIKIFGGKTSTKKGLETVGKLTGVPGATQIRKFTDYLKEED
jgi:hypothetical protein